VFLPFWRIADLEHGFAAVAFRHVIGGQSTTDGSVHHREAVIREGLIIHLLSCKKPPQVFPATALLNTDDCIFFARRLTDHILRSENRLRRSKGWKYWLPGRKLKPIVWTKADDLLPRESAYLAWTSGFVPDRSFSID
jgi:hypothetical protein